jgi:membrane protein DedA with SNARE-associated domain
VGPSAFFVHFREASGFPPRETHLPSGSDFFKCLFFSQQSFEPFGQFSFWLSLGSDSNFLLQFSGGPSGEADRVLDWQRFFRGARPFPKRFVETGNGSERHVLKAGFSARLLYFPFALSNYLFGVINLKWPSFMLGTFLGILPGVYLAAGVGEGLAHFLREGGQDPTHFPWAWIVARVLLALGILFWSFVREKKRVSESVRGRNLPED